MDTTLVPRILETYHQARTMFDALVQSHGVDTRFGVRKVQIQRGGFDEAPGQLRYRVVVEAAPTRTAHERMALAAFREGFDATVAQQVAPFLETVQRICRFVAARFPPQSNDRSDASPDVHPNSRLVGSRQALRLRGEQLFRVPSGGRWKGEVWDSITAGPGAGPIPDGVGGVVPSGLRSPPFATPRPDLGVVPA